MASSKSASNRPIHHCVDIEGHRLAVIEHVPARATAAVPLVLLHGIGMTPRAWPHILPQALAGRRCLAVALPAHFPSRAPREVDRRPHYAPACSRRRWWKR